MKKLELLAIDSLKQLDCDELINYINYLEYYIYYQHGIITEAWKSLFNKELDDVIIREGEE